MQRDVGARPVLELSASMVSEHGQKERGVTMRTRYGGERRTPAELRAICANIRLSRIYGWGGDAIVLAGLGVIAFAV